VVIW
jgi:hypothetical protein